MGEQTLSAVCVPGQFAEFVHHCCRLSTALLTRVLDFFHLEKREILTQFSVVLK